LRFASIILDVDSTLTSVEGIAWLATRRGREVTDAVDAMTNDAMTGALPLDAVYAKRLSLVRPSRSDLAALAGAYSTGLVPGARDAIRTLRAAGVHIALVSGGIREAILPFAAELGFPAGDVHAVELHFTPDGAFAGFDAATPLACAGGKPRVARTLGLRGPVLAVGDGSTDAELKPCVDAFAAFTGVARRESVVAVADYVITQFAELPALVL
jgi:HAD superfamily phosphoserine phosphatase-like hydrolase